MGAPQSPSENNAAPTSPGQKAQQAQAALDARSASPHTMTAQDGSYAVARAQREQAAAQAQKAQRALAKMLSEKPSTMFGLGSPSRTQNGLNLNLSVQSATGVLGADRLAAARKKDGERRLAQHRGSWQSLGLERWRPALENYVANVKPGNQTALNTAREPFARYLNQIHQRLHELFADLFLGHLNQLPKEHPLNNQDMSTHLEIALNKEDGRVVRMGITKSSGVTAFDVGALDSVERAAPYGPPPNAILSSDGNVYLHWEFHRRPELACSTYFARPFIIDLGQTPTTPSVEPPKKPGYEQEGSAPAEKKSGALDGLPDQPTQAKVARARSTSSRQP
jgi:TonB family protein